MAFRGWPVESIEFYEGLIDDNSKAYWQANKQIYDRDVAGPMNELLEELADEFGEGKIFRPYRDVRFSKDKSPYKTMMGAALTGRGYVQFSVDGLGVGSGYYSMEPPQLERFRKAIVNETTGPELDRIVEAVSDAGANISAHDLLKTAPRGYPKDHPRIELLRHKGLITWREWPPGAWLGTAKAKQRVVDALRAGRPLVGWLDEHVGPT